MVLGRRGKKRDSPSCSCRETGISVTTRVAAKEGGEDQRSGKKRKADPAPQKGAVDREEEGRVGISDRKREEKKRLDHLL